MRYFLVLSLIFWFAVAVGLMECSKQVKQAHYGEASWTLQGETSHLDCPGQHAWFVEASGTQFFMGCRS